MYGHVSQRTYCGSYSLSCFQITATSGVGNIEIYVYLSLLTIPIIISRMVALVKFFFDIKVVISRVYRGVQSDFGKEKIEKVSDSAIRALLTNLVI